MPENSPSQPLPGVSPNPERLTIRQYQQLAKQTDKTAGKSQSALDLPLLGLFGEVGSLLSELKKKQRDESSYFGYEASVVEELGDVLWYLSALATRTGIELAAIANSIICDLDSDSGETAFTALQPDLTIAGPQSPEKFEGTLMRLAADVGRLLTKFTEGNTSPDILAAHMDSIFRALIDASNDAGVSLANAAHSNLVKIFDRWPQERIYPALLDEDDESDEQLPRQIHIEIFEKEVNDQTYVFQRCNGIFIGDRLTDNKLEKDDYRFHDVFHLAYAAKLGWSPVLRALFRLKRKSRPEIDESEDGARAILIEEGVSTWIFNHATHLNYYDGLNSVDYGLLKSARRLVAGYEAESCPLWLWEEAILAGYEMFRALRIHRSGIVTADLSKRTITFASKTE